MGFVSYNSVVGNFWPSKWTTGSSDAAVSFFFNRLIFYTHYILGLVLQRPPRKRLWIIGTSIRGLSYMHLHWRCRHSLLALRMLDYVWFYFCSLPLSHQNLHLHFSSLETNAIDLKLQCIAQNSLSLWTITFLVIWPTLLWVLDYQTFLAMATNKLQYSSKLFIVLLLQAQLCGQWCVVFGSGNTYLYCRPRFFFLETLESSYCC